MRLRPGSNIATTFDTVSVCHKRVTKTRNIEKLNIKLNEQEMLAFFKKYDVNKDGKLSWGELKRAFSELGVTWVTWTTDRALVKADEDGDGYISEREMDRASLPSKRVLEPSSWGGNARYVDMSMMCSSQVEQLKQGRRFGFVKYIEAMCATLDKRDLKKDVEHVCVLLGLVREIHLIPNLQQVCAKERFNNVKAFMSGGLWVWMEFRSMETCYFVELKLASKSFTIDERVVWGTLLVCLFVLGHLCVSRRWQKGRGRFYL
ncbi:hypothetical protein L1987_80434 [Smallanthus sonchifolius]|uniref:Uncharacterized protein n=1 Tax=Smallanthus sonchifolius TaxID=185202 RepID=A0ACB8YN25_9ASTR|nr:hypothetical protein L1987_80434 [Smallanthus sonchifolius]